MPCELLIVGELMSNRDEQLGHPFSDGNGKFLRAMLRQSNIDPNRVEYTNVFNRSAPRGSVYSLCGPKSAGIPNMRYLKRGKYVAAEHASHVRHLWKQVNTLQPNLILALGDAALWALTSHESVLKMRGYLSEGNAAIPNRKILCTHHPRDIQRDRSLMPYWLADLAKARKQMTFPELIRPSHELWLEPTLDEMEQFLHEHIMPSHELSVDIENKPQFLTCVGFAPTPEIALVVPFFDERKKGNNYWATAQEEQAAWRWVRRVLSLGKAVGGHNYIYDMQHLWRWNAVPNPDAAWDTMLMHHSLQPEMKKSLGILASLYTQEVSWKGMRTETMKKED